MAEAGFDAEELLNTTKMQGVKDKLKANTDLYVLHHRSNICNAVD